MFRGTDAAARLNWSRGGPLPRGVLEDRSLTSARKSIAQRYTSSFWKLSTVGRIVVRSNDHVAVADHVHDHAMGTVDVGRIGHIVRLWTDSLSRPSRPDRWLSNAWAMPAAVPARANRIARPRLGERVPAWHRAWNDACFLL
jgi:hypothetical protein